jgi:hypothetical protein
MATKAAMVAVLGGPRRFTVDLNAGGVPVRAVFCSHASDEADRRLRW